MTPSVPHWGSWVLEQIHDTSRTKSYMRRRRLVKRILSAIHERKLWNQQGQQTNWQRGSHATSSSSFYWNICSKKAKILFATLIPDCTVRTSRDTVFRDTNFIIQSPLTCLITQLPSRNSDERIDRRSPSSVTRDRLRVFWAQSQVNESISKQQREHASGVYPGPHLVMNGSPAESSFISADANWPHCGRWWNEQKFMNSAGQTNRDPSTACS